MIYLLFTNRPQFAPFALEQYRKCKKSARLVILDNGQTGTAEYLMQTDEYHHIPQCKNTGEMFVWFRNEYKNIRDDILIMDDDIFILSDIVKEQVEWIKRGYDRIHYSVCGMYSTTTNRYIETNWSAAKTGAGFSISKNIWIRGRVKPNNDWMAYYYISLPEHNLKHIPTVQIIHLIHGENMDNTDSIMDKAIVQGIAIEKNCPVSINI